MRFNADYHCAASHGLPLFGVSPELHGLVHSDMQLASIMRAYRLREHSGEGESSDFVMHASVEQCDASVLYSAYEAIYSKHEACKSESEPQIAAG